MSFTPSVRRWGDRNLVLNTPTIEWFIDSFVEESLRRDPDVSPLYADLSNMPSALFTIGTLDPLVDDTLFMHSRWIAAGNQADIAIYPGGVHGFTLLPCRIGKEAIGRSWTRTKRVVFRSSAFRRRQQRLQSGDCRWHHILLRTCGQVGASSVLTPGHPLADDQ